MDCCAGENGCDFCQPVQEDPHPRLTVEEELSHSCLEMVFVGQSKESLSEVDDKLPCSG